LSPTAVVPPLPAGVAVVEEQPALAEVPLARNPRWLERYDWLEHGITMRGAAEPFDMGLFGSARVADTQRRWRQLREVTAMRRAVHARQVHGARVLRHHAGEPGLFVADAADGHVTEAPGVLLTISVADCVPIYLVAPARRTVGVLHAGWRGVAAGMLEAGLARLSADWHIETADVEVHFGPAICGACYEVGAEVVRGIGLEEPAQDAAAHVDLRATLAARAVAAGIPPARITVSAHCTRCADTGFFSHRGGQPERQIAFAGIREPHG
jgi:polyphenol oxidase